MSSHQSVNIELLYFDSCPMWAGTRDLVERVTGVAPRLRRVETIDEAEELGFTGSPTLLVDGVDPWASQAGSVGLACRIYRAPDGSRVEGPTEEMIAEALGPSE